MTGRTKTPEQVQDLKDVRGAYIAIDGAPPIDEQGRALVIDVETGARRAVDIPEPPAEISEYARAAWIRLWQSPMAAVFADADMEALFRYIVLLSKRQELWEEFTRIGPLVQGSMSTPAKPIVVQNPLHRIVRDLSAEIAHYEERLGLTPFARMRLGVTYLQAKTMQRDLKGDARERLERQPFTVEAED